MRGLPAGFGFAVVLAAVFRPAADVVRRAVPDDLAELAFGDVVPAVRDVRDVRPADARAVPPAFGDEPFFADDDSGFAARARDVPGADFDDPEDRDGDDDLDGDFTDDLDDPDDRGDAAGLLPFVEATATLAVDIAFAASVSDFVAAVIALVAEFIACIAVDMVFAEVVALVAAAVILVAAVETFEAAVETPRAALAGVAVPFLDVLDRAVPPADAVLRLDVLLADLVRVPAAGLRRTGVRVVVRAGTDLPPS